MPIETRRVVTGLDANGKAVVISDGPSTQVFSRPERPLVTIFNMWRTDETPAPIDGAPESLTEPFQLMPPTGGSVCRIIEFRPESEMDVPPEEISKAFADMGAGKNVVEGARHPGMHSTDTVDYAIIIKGSITMLLDEEDVELKAGDVLVQRGTNHAWANRGTEPCVIAFILIDGAWAEK